jgi:hypothetical protein
VSNLSNCINIEKEVKMAKMNYAEIRVTVGEMTDVTRTYHDGYAFAAGYLGSMVSELVAALPKHKQVEYIRSMQETTKKYADLVAEKQQLPVSA